MTTESQGFSGQVSNIPARAASPADRIRRYVEMRAEKPLLGLGDSVHAIHLSTKYEAELTFEDLRQYVSQRDDMLCALQTLLRWNEGIAAGRGNHYPLEHADMARAAIAIATGSQSGTAGNASAMKELPGSHELTVNAPSNQTNGLRPKGLAASGLSRQGEF